jgi:hypothetical protein
MSKPTVIFRCVAGSRLYGLDTPLSDTDLKEVVVPSKRDLFFGRGSDIVKTQIRTKGAKSGPGETETETIPLKQFVDLAVDGHFNVLDILFATATVHVLAQTETWTTLWENRAMFLTSRADSMLGYCRHQAALHGEKGKRIAALDAIIAVLGREIAETRMEGVAGRIAETVAEYADHARFKDVLGGDPQRRIPHLSVAGASAGMESSVGTALGIFTRRRASYGGRSEKSAAEGGVDWKAMSHAVRIGQQSVEYLTTGSLTFPLPRAAHLLSIKLGLVPKGQVEEEIVAVATEVEEAAAGSPLPREIDRSALEDLVFDLYEQTLAESDRAVVSGWSTPRP